MNRRRLSLVLKFYGNTCVPTFGYTVYSQVWKNLDHVLNGNETSGEFYHQCSPWCIYLVLVRGKPAYDEGFGSLDTTKNRHPPR